MPGASSRGADSPVGSAQGPDSVLTEQLPLPGQDLFWFQASPAAPRPAVTAGPRVGRALARLFRTYVGARAVVGVLLALLHLGSSIAGASLQSSALLVSGLYVVQVLAVAGWMWASGWSDGSGRSGPRAAPPGPALIAFTVGADALAFMALLAIESSTSFNFGALLVLPVLMAGVLMPRRLALATAAAVTLSLLAQAWWSALQAPTGPSPWLASGLAGIGLFAIAWLAGELVARLLREERSAMDSREYARQQALLNQLVIEEMGEGVLVLNREGRVLAANPAARALLGLTDPPLGAQPSGAPPQAHWSALLEAVERAHAQGRWPAAGRELSLAAPGQAASKVRARIRFTRLDPAEVQPGQEEAAAEDLCVLLLEDERAVQGRVQQEKLAAMGRMSAGIAHEIRNPLAAMAQASELLAEDGLAVPQQRLVAIMADNVQRLRRLVDDMLDALPSATVEARPLDAAALIRASATEWARTARVSPALVELALPPAGLQVLFEPEHLRRVLVNLLENAGRHASGHAGAVKVELAEDGRNEAVLTVSNDGPPVPPEVEIHMFEPFFSTRSRGSGLGLYICKELCERHGATIHLLQRTPDARHRTAFEIRLQRPWAAPDGGGTA
jgi:two-component system sensor histidine kinase PilS (NtrC family)